MNAPRVDLGDAYLAQVAHELRGSLNAILGWAEFLRTNAGEDSARRRAAETIIRHARQQTQMVGELIDTWRLASGTLALTFVPLGMSSLVSAAIDAVRPQADVKSATIELRDHTSPRLRIRGDPKRLGQTVLGLLVNAVHFAPEGSTIAVCLVGDTEKMRLTVHDEGPGVPLSSLPFLFERDPPVDRTSSRAAFRLGLAFAHAMVVRHGGLLSATNGDGGGLTFHLDLPVGSPDVEGATRDPLTTTNPVATGPNSLRGLRVLLVDDEPDAREALIGILQHHGAVVQEASSAADAIEALQHDSFDVLLADIGMPGADGYDLIRYIRALKSHAAARVPAAAVTAFTSDADRQRALEAGFQVHLAKPVDPAALVETVVLLSRH